MSEQLSTLDVLKAARELIADPARWQQGWFAADADGIGCRGNSEGAVSFCALGAIEHITGGNVWIDDFTTPAEAALLDAAERLYPDMSDPAAVNDELGHEAVLRVYDEAIRREEAKSE